MYGCVRESIWKKEFVVMITYIDKYTFFYIHFYFVCVRVCVRENVIKSCLRGIFCHMPHAYKKMYAYVFIYVRIHYNTHLIRFLPPPPLSLSVTHIHFIQWMILYVYISVCVYVCVSATFHNRQKDMLSWTHVFVRNDMTRNPLTAPYRSPYKIVQRNSDNVYTLCINGRHCRFNYLLPRFHRR